LAPNFSAFAAGIMVNMIADKSFAPLAFRFNQSAGLQPKLALCSVMALFAEEQT
jgi:hypothetical protein